MSTCLSEGDSWYFPKGNDELLASSRVSAARVENLGECVERHETIRRKDADSRSVQVARPSETDGDATAEGRRRLPTMCSTSLVTSLVTNTLPQDGDNEQARTARYKVSSLRQPG